MGGGFGGHTIHLVDTKEINSYIEFITDKYFEKYNITPNTYIISFTDGVQIIDNIKCWLVIFILNFDSSSLNK